MCVCVCARVLHMTFVTSINPKQSFRLKCIFSMKTFCHRIFHQNIICYYEFISIKHKRTQHMLFSKCPTSRIPFNVFHHFKLYWIDIIAHVFHFRLRCQWAQERRDRVWRCWMFNGWFGCILSNSEVIWTLHGKCRERKREWYDMHRLFWFVFQLNFSDFVMLIRFLSGHAQVWEPVTMSMCVRVDFNAWNKMVWWHNAGKKITANNYNGN